MPAVAQPGHSALTTAQDSPEYGFAKSGMSHVVFARFVPVGISGDAFDIGADVNLH